MAKRGRRDRADVADQCLARVEDDPLRDSLKSSVGWLWVVALLALPGCDQLFGLSELKAPSLDRGSLPKNKAIFCDIEDIRYPRKCADEADKKLGVGVPLTQAAIALTERRTGHIGLDYAPFARAYWECGDEPVAVTFRSAFPEGEQVCLNCGDSIGPSPRPHADENAACVALCEDLNGNGESPPTPAVATFCRLAEVGWHPDHAHTSTNAATCISGACMDDGAPNFDDPRRTANLVGWTDVTPGVDVNLNNLTRTAATTGQYDVGAASTELITRGDGYVEFTVGAESAWVECGLSSFPTGPDNDPSLNDISFGLMLQRLAGASVGEVFVVEHGIGNPHGAFANYAVGDRLRVTVTDRFDGTADIAYFVLPAACASAGCPGTPPLPYSPGPAYYPFRVDASLRDLGATLNDVRIVRIQ
jgi:hypothetical protein